jgi:hypothetical protein
MKHKAIISGGIALALLALLAPTLLAAKGSSRVEGQVVEVREQVRVDGAEASDELTIRTRQGEELRLRVGAAGTCTDCVRAGDRVRVRLMAGPDPGGAFQVRTMKVRRTGATYRYCNRSGEPLGVQERWRHRQEGATGSQQSGARQGQAAGRRGGGGRR